jgi:hypothetical protein
MTLSPFIYQRETGNYKSEVHHQLFGKQGDVPDQYALTIIR